MTAGARSHAATLNEPAFSFGAECGNDFFGGIVVNGLK